MILLAKSKKYQNYCVAGMNYYGELVRIVSDDDSIKCAVKRDDMLYQNGQEPQIFDVVNVPIKKKIKFHPFQPENYLLDKRYCWKKIGELTAKEKLEQLANKDEYIFYDTDRKVSNYSIPKNPLKRKSLTLVKPDECEIYGLYDGANYKVRMNINYNHRWYKNLCVTDKEFERNFQEGKINQDQQSTNLLLISLGEEFHGNHYKLVSSIL